jgi:hypothetical protein
MYCGVTLGLTVLVFGARHILFQRKAAASRDKLAPIELEELDEEEDFGEEEVRTDESDVNEDEEDINSSNRAEQS